MRDNAVSRIENLQIWQQQLVVLDLSHNDIESMSGVERLTNLEALSLSANCIKVMSDVRSLTKLQFLDLKRNKISRIDGVSEHPSLRVLCLSENRLTRLSGVTNMPHLGEIDLRENQIQTLDPLFGMDQLRRVFLSNNRIERWEGLGGLTTATTVTEVTLDGNPLVRTATFRRFARLGNSELEKLEFGWPEKALASFVPSNTSADTIGHRSMAGDLSNPVSARGHESSVRDTNTTATSVGGSKPPDPASLQSISKGDGSSESATTIELEASTCASKIGSPSQVTHPIALDELPSNDLEPASNSSSPSVIDGSSDINSDPEDADEGQSSGTRSSLSRSQLSSDKDANDQSEGDYKESERSTDAPSDIEDQYIQKENEETRKACRLQGESDEDVDKTIQETSQFPSGNRSRVSSQSSQEMTSPSSQQASDLKRFCPLLKLTDAACLRRLELKSDRKHLVICGGHGLNEVDENSQFIPGPLDFLLNVLQKRRNSNTVNLSNIIEVTICGFPWHSVVKELSSLRSTMPHLEALTLLDNGLGRMGEITQLIDLKFLKRLTIYAKAPHTPRESTDFQDPAVLQCVPNSLGTGFTSGFSEECPSSEDSNLVGNPAVIQAGRYWRPFLIWSLKPTLGLQVLDGKTGVNAPVAASTWYPALTCGSSKSNRPERRMVLGARELGRYKVHIAALSEDRFSEQGQMEEVGAGYTFFWSGR
ncbi:unnamed protein product [Schistocephalus solidus]|uniref:Outer arm dynein light chain 1 n=1 Tax=Schistocephalus solidus TaxID=70667 RepID=A0A183SHC0_SCHSO|nr:unnamed protein product [Schistocephalus solidus]